MNKLSLILLALLGAAVLVGCGPKVEPMPVTGEKTPEAKFVDEMVAKANGDINRLTAEERAELDRITRGNGQTIISQSANR
ncbi:MAG: hypothetical protein MH204_04660 [Fimbriimonadaceae bacterium]|nr:hypothetical protein [Fimbriimonadaceae bacterium]